jgi:hypothetical protein
MRSAYAGVDIGGVASGLYVGLTYAHFAGFLGAGD